MNSGEDIQEICGGCLLGLGWVVGYQQYPGLELFRLELQAITEKIIDVKVISIRDGGLVSIESHPSLMIIATASQFHVYLPFIGPVYCLA